MADLQTDKEINRVNTNLHLKSQLPIINNYENHTSPKVLKTNGRTK